MANNKLPAILAFFCLLAGGTIWVVFKIKQDKKDIQYQQEKIILHNKVGAQDGWFYKMGKQQNENYAYPTNEMILKYDFNKGVEPLRVFVDDLNEYRFYCINQVLIKNNIEYAYYKTDKAIQLIVFLNNKDTQKKILDDFNYYKISYTVQE